MREVNVPAVMATCASWALSSTTSTGPREIQEDAQPEMNRDVQEATTPVTGSSSVK